MELRVPKPNYNEYSNMYLIGIPLLVFAIALMIIGMFYITTGSPVDRAIEFTGGVEIRLEAPDGSDEINTVLSDFNILGISSVAATDDYIVRLDQDTDASEIETVIEDAEEYTLKEFSRVSPTIGESAQRTALIGLGMSFLLMSLLVIVLFRSFVPAIAVLASAVSDLIIPIAMMNLLNIPLSMGTVGALLMIIGYSVDSDILLNTHVIKDSHKSFIERVHDAMDTGVVMTLTSCSAMIVMAVLATIMNIDLLADMGTVLAIGLLVDLMNTYMLNVGILRYYTRGDFE